jgi:hypothetical protein
VAAKVDELVQYCGRKQIPKQLVKKVVVRKRLCLRPILYYLKTRTFAKTAVVRNTPLFEPFKYQMHHFILPRRARDKHRENSKKEWRFSQRMEMETYSYHNLLTRVPLFREHLDEYFDPESRSMETKQNKAAMEVRTTTIIDAYLALRVSFPPQLSQSSCSY